MRRFLPSLQVQPWIGCEDDGEVEGRSLTIRWGRWSIEIALGRHNGRLADIEHEGDAA